MQNRKNNTSVAKNIFTFLKSASSEQWMEFLESFLQTSYYDYLKDKQDYELTAYEWLCVKLIKKHRQEIFTDALTSAIIANNLILAKDLFFNGCNLDLPNRHRETPLFVAVVLRCHGFVKLLLEYGADPDFSLPNSPPPLWEACVNGDIGIIRLLLKADADRRVVFNGMTLYECFKEKHAHAEIEALLCAMPVPYGQEWYINHLKALKYDLKSSGFCEALAVLGKSAFLTNQMSAFNRRIFLLASIQPDQLEERISDVQKKFVSRIEMLKSDLLKRWKIKKEKALSMQQRKFFYRSLQKKIEDERAALTDNERILLDIPAYFDSLQLIQDEYHFRPWLGRLYNQVSLAERLMMSSALEALGGNIEMAKFSGVYNKEELTEYFDSLRYAFAQGQAFGYPFALIFEDFVHMILVGYDDNADLFCFLNANSLPAKFISNSQKLAEAVLHAFTDEDQFIMETKVFIASHPQNITDQASYLQNFKMHLKTWLEHPRFQKMHSVTNEKKAFRDETNSLWAHAAAEVGDLDKLLELLTPRVDCYENNNKGRTPITLAAICGDPTVIEGLGKAGVDLHYVNALGYTAATNAVFAGNLETLKMLNNYIDLNRRDNRGETPATSAASIKDVECMKTLVALDVDLSLPNQKGYSPMLVAVTNGDIPMVSVLVAANVDLVRKYKMGTAWKASVEYQQPEVMNILVNEGISVNTRMRINRIMGVTAAHFAARQRDMSMLRVIEKHGGAFNKRCFGLFPRDFAKTPFGYAKKTKDQRVIYFIQSVQDRQKFFALLEELQKYLTEDKKAQLEQYKKFVSNKWKWYDVNDQHELFSEFVKQRRPKFKSILDKIKKRQHKNTFFIPAKQYVRVQNQPHTVMGFTQKRD